MGMSVVDELHELAKQIRHVKFRDQVERDRILETGEMLIRHKMPDAKAKTYIDKFENLRFDPSFGPTEEQYKREVWSNACAKAGSILSAAKQLEYIEGEPNIILPIDVLEQVFERFHVITRQLRSRYKSRPTLEVSDEYDVQDLTHALLKLYFDDIRPEEWVPSYAGKSSRVDFLLKKEQIIVEIKKTRKNLTGSEVGSQLIEDIARYEHHPDCKTLVCFVYDPEGLIANPRGLESDLERDAGAFPIRVYVRP
jgi:hypothetical protein